jgi:hypothetical protein
MYSLFSERIKNPLRLVTLIYSFLKRVPECAIQVYNFTLHISIVGSVVECSPATRAARVRFPDDADTLFGSNKEVNWRKYTSLRQ